MSLLSLIARGGLAGACAGLLSGVVSLFLAEPVIDRAIALEHATSTEPHEELFTRDVQHIGLLIATVLTGLAIGILFGLVYAILHRTDPSADPWARSLRLGAAGFLGVSLLPFLRFPANPPGVGDPDTVGQRTVTWIAAMVIGLTAVAIARYLYSPTPARQLASAGVVVAAAAILFLLPGTTDASAVPADLLWTFRMMALLSSAVLWAGLGVAFGLAGLRTQTVSTASAVTA